MKHIPVLQNEVMSLLAPKTNQNFIDATVGYASHAKMILKKTGPKGKLLAIDQDSATLEIAKDNLTEFGGRVSFARTSFTNLGLIIRDWKVKDISGILIDLGPNTPQLLDDKRGFSFRKDAPLDMRMNPDTKLTAEVIVNKYSPKDLIEVLKTGEERFAKPITVNIIKSRHNQPIRTTLELVEIIRISTPPKYRFSEKTHFATGTFRALRMAVNDELGSIESVLPQAVQAVSVGGKIAIITFHSLEDRIVKKYFRDNNNLEVLTQKPVVASEHEISENASSRSAKLRVAIKK